MQINEQIYQAIVIKELKHEARFSDRQIRMLEWSQITDKQQIRSGYGREVVISEELYNALVSIPVSGRRVFKIKRSSLLLEVPEYPERKPIRDEIESDRDKLAKLIAEKLLS